MINSQSEHSIDKRHIKAMALFAIEYIPQVDESTLLKLVDLINITGNFNAISDRQLLRKMSLLISLVPGTCRRTLLTLIELLGIGVSANSGDESDQLWFSLSSP